MLDTIGNQSNVESLSISLNGKLHTKIFFALIEAFASRRNWTISLWPIEEAINSGVLYSFINFDEIRSRFETELKQISRYQRTIEYRTSQNTIPDLCNRSLLYSSRSIGLTNRFDSL